MTYVQFLLLFLVAPAALMLAFHGTTQVRTTLALAGGIALAALVYSVPWLLAFVRLDAWEFAPGRVAAAVGRVPIEAFLFVVLQVLFTTVLAMLVLRRRWWES